MKFIPTPLAGSFIVEPERKGDDRGFLARTFCETEFAAAGLIPRFAQANMVFNSRRGTLRGMHYQIPPDAEAKLVRVVRGAIHDVIVDLRPNSPSFLRSFGAPLNDENGHAMYVPTGFAHGMITLTDNVEVLYLMSAPYAPKSERGLRFNDPALDIEWPITPLEISAKDADWPYIDAAYHRFDLFDAAG